MAVNTPTPVAIAPAPTANSFEHAHIDICNRVDGVVVECHANAFRRDSDGNTTLIANLPMHAIKDGDTDLVTELAGAHPGLSPDRLLAVATDAAARYEAFRSAGVPAGLAFQGGLRDAVYAELKLVGVIPA